MKHFMARIVLLLLLTAMSCGPVTAQNKSVIQAKADTTAVDTSANDAHLAGKLDEAAAPSSRLSFD